MSAMPSVLLLDPDELGMIPDLVRALGATVREVSGEPAGAELEGYWDLLVTTGRRAQSLPEAWDPDLGAKPTWIAVLTRDFLPLREQLRDLGVDYLVRAAANRRIVELLLAHCMYRGGEARSLPRLLVGTRVEYSAGGRTHMATVAELSREGCRLWTSSAAPLGSSVAVIFPPGLLATGASRLRGEVVRVVEEAPDRNVVAIAFAPGDAIEGDQFEAIGEGRAIGTVLTRLGGAHDIDGLRNEIVLDNVDRRRDARGLYARRVPIVGADGCRVIVGRDLSSRGMRVDSDADVRVGERLRLAIHGARRRDPLVVEATVARDDGDDGLLLRFDEAVPPVKRALEELVAGLPEVERLARAKPAFQLILSTAVRDET